MGWAEAIAALFKIIGSLLDMKAKNQLDQAMVDKVLHTMTPLLPPKE